MIRKTNQVMSVALLLAAIAPTAVHAATWGIEVWYQDTAPYDQNAPFCQTGAPCLGAPSVKVCLQGTSTCQTTISGGGTRIAFAGLAPSTDYTACLTDMPGWRLNSGSAGGAQVAATDCVTHNTGGSSDLTTAMYVQKQGALRVWKIHDDEYPVEGGPNSPTNPLDGWHMSVTTPALTGVTGSSDLPGRTTMTSYDIKADNGTNQYEICEELQPGWINRYACRGNCGEFEQYTTTTNGNLVCITITLLQSTNPDFTVFFGNQQVQELIPCAILGKSLVRIGEGSTITATPHSVCSNDALTTSAQVTVDTKVLARGNMSLGEGSKVGDEASMNGNLTTGQAVRIGDADGPDDVDVRSGGDINLLCGSGAEGICEYAGAISGCGDCGVEQVNAVPPIAQPFALPTCNAENLPGGPNISTSPASNAYTTGGSQGPLAAGDYGTVNFATNNQVEFTGGQYTFLSLKFNAQTKLKILAPTTVRVQNKLQFADGVKMELAAGVEVGEVVWLVDGAADAAEHRAGAKTVLYGTICGLDSTINIGGGAVVNGALIGNQVWLGADVMFTANPALSIFTP